ncbi:hypothetical protein CONPUDRAFT_85505 [Coniophora puteana RWD-64-598 SS2]|uniref:Uncharacterized protein n=1 Tax=Coniophora puteana (strain RWD-64-598) TaxID=741705 RepID=A0A5M3M868_CONPW|nr:uncharacterized protein CONPUDRAFT_85505 [Coniophora puteana RWD-64-598 SS2]EIW75243.1 hypothetical protein CONPUDRAFT_85505 [Coniophora puteana RWD-64-598 SS2]
MPPSARSDFISQQSVLSVHQPDDSVRCARSEDLIGPGTPGNPNPYRASRGGAERLTR